MSEQPTTLREDLEELDRLKKQATRLNREAKDAAKERDIWQRHCMDRMEGEGFDSLKAGGRSFVCVREKVYATVNDRAAFVAWAQKNSPDHIKIVEKDGELNSLVRSCLDDGEELPPGVSYYSKDYISVTGK
jgi:hypothetical protein